MANRNPGQNKGKGIVERTLKNLKYIQDAHARCVDVHVVTHLVTSLLGLIVLPQQIGLEKCIKELKLEDLKCCGWPEWNITWRKDETENLGLLIYHIRNAAAHGHYKFSSECRHLSEVKITVQDKGGWEAEIQADKLYKFCLQFVKRVYDLDPKMPDCKKCFPEVPPHTRG